MTDSDFGPLLPYIQDENVTDINYNGKTVWIDDLMRGRYPADITLSRSFIEHFTARVADNVSESFNKYHPLLEAETDTLRISIIHEEFANTGRSISIRKTPVVRRLTRQKMLDEDYCSAEFLDFIKKCVAAKMNMLMCGPPGTGKTEFLKFLTADIPAEDRVITIEDNLEIHYSEINPGKDCVELKVDGDGGDEEDRFTYVTAIKACLRQNPQWILLSEARSTEVKYLLESMSTGTHCLTTLHTDDVRKVPDRIKNMVQDSVIAARIENDVYAFLDAAILIKKKIKNGRIHRYIDQMCFFSREEGNTNVIAMVMENGTMINKELPLQIRNKFAHANILDPFSSDNAVPTANELVGENGEEKDRVANEQSEEAEYSDKEGETEQAVNSEVSDFETVNGQEGESSENEGLERETSVSQEESKSDSQSTGAQEENDIVEKIDTAMTEDNVLYFSFYEHKQDDAARLRRAQKNNKQ